MVCSSNQYRRCCAHCFLHRAFQPSKSRSNSTSRNKSQSQNLQQPGNLEKNVTIQYEFLDLRNAKFE